MNKNYGNKMKIFSFILIGIFLVSFVSALGITQPQPQNIQLKPGQSSFFTLQVQSDDFPLKCVPIIREADGLELAFNQEYNIEANQEYNLQPQVIVPEQIGFGTYKANFCLECSPSGEVEGSRVIPVICNLPVSVNVVSERTQVNRFDEQAGNIGFITVLVILSISILLLALVIFYLIARRKRTSI